ncbi:hypothetical protein [Asticcacaulis tiandongensis]|uniref:hypothetical protein n=1 Tax=Asticcacaulis tiandongensis TaxID=2565365 RepID=UPI001129947F|nr:hypothetical protein [Asticcacaulis tiandongensis]
MEGNILFSVGIVAVFLALAVFLRYRLGKAAWPYHGGGAKGYLNDILLEVFASYVPLLIIIFGVRIYLEYNPQPDNSPLILGSVVIAVAAMLVARRLPVAKAASARLLDARNKRWEADKMPSDQKGE